MGYLSVGKLSWDATPYNNDEMEMFGRTGNTPESPLAFNNALKDPVKKKIYETAKAARLAQTKATAAKAEATAVQEQLAAQSQTSAAMAASSKTSMTTWFLVGGGLAALAVVLVVTRKKS